MKKSVLKIVSVLLLLVIACSAVACSKDDDIPDGMQNAAADSMPFDLFVPSNWISQAQSGISGARVSSSDKSNVTVTVYLPAEVLTPADYWEDFCLPEYENGVLQDFSVMDEQCEETTLGGLNAEKYVFVYTLDGVTYEVMQIITSKDDTLYTLTYTAESAMYAAHLEEVESIRSNFRFR